MAGNFVAEYENDTTYFVQPDHLGSTRLVTDLNQNVVQNVDYLPYGELNSGNSGYTTHMFMGNERDGETGLDETWFRKYSSNLGRWMTPDPAGLAAVDASNPQSWNRYAYVLNNPLVWIDPLGLCGGTGDYPGLPCPSGGTITVTASAPDEPTIDALGGDSGNPFGDPFGGATSNDINAEAQIFAGGHRAGGGLNQLKPLMEAQEKADLFITKRILLPGMMILGGLTISGSALVVSVGACSTGVGCLALVGTVPTFLGGLGLAYEGAYYAVNQNFYNPFHH